MAGCRKDGEARRERDEVATQRKVRTSRQLGRPSGVERRTGNATAMGPRSCDDKPIHPDRRSAARAKPWPRGTSPAAIDSVSRPPGSARSAPPEARPFFGTGRAPGTKSNRTRPRATEHHAAVAQTGRAPLFQSGPSGFESLSLHRSRAGSSAAEHVADNDGVAGSTPARRTDTY